MNEQYRKILKKAACDVRFAQAFAIYMLLPKDDQKEILEFAEGLAKDRQMGN
jgi:hypothetical protein